MSKSKQELRNRLEGAEKVETVGLEELLAAVRGQEEQPVYIEDGRSKGWFRK